MIYFLNFNYRTFYFTNTNETPVTILHVHSYRVKGLGFKVRVQSLGLALIAPRKLHMPQNSYTRNSL